MSEIPVTLDLDDDATRYIEKIVLDRRHAYEHIAGQKARIKFLFEQLEEDNSQKDQLILSLRRRVTNQRKELRQFYETPQPNAAPRAEHAQDRSSREGEGEGEAEEVGDAAI